MSTNTVAVAFGARASETATMNPDVQAITKGQTPAPGGGEVSASDMKLGSPVVVACDEAYAMPLATALRSIVDTTASHQIEFHILFDNFAEPTQRRVEASVPSRSATIQWHKVDIARFNGLFVTDHASPMTFARLLIPDVLPPETTRALYVDADLIAMRDITALAETDLQGNLVGAVRDDFLDAAVPMGHPASRGAPHVTRYFNAGVLVIDVAGWRSEGIADAAYRYLARHQPSPFMDQDALNVACDDRWLELDGRWNFQQHLHYSPAWTERGDYPWVVHFIEGRKPWRAEVRHPWADTFDRIRSRTQFARGRRERLRDAMVRFSAGAGNRIASIRMRFVR